MTKSLYASLNSLALVIALAVNGMAVFLPINNMSSEELSELYPSLFTPAEVTFSIWSVIYLLLIGFVFYQWRRYVANPAVPLPEFARLSLWFSLSCILNAAWLLAWHHLYTALSVAIMLTLLYVLSKIFLLVKKNKAESWGEKIWLHIPFTVYLAWISVATIANISAFLTSLEFDGGFFSPEGWTAVMMTAAAGLAFVVTSKFRVPGFTGIILWGLLGIFMRWQYSDYVVITYTAAILMTLLFVYMLYVMVTKSAAPHRS